MSSDENEVVENVDKSVPESSTEQSNSDNSTDDSLGITLKGVVLTAMVIIFLVILFNVWVKPLLSPTNHSPASIFNYKNDVGETQ